MAVRNPEKAFGARWIVCLSSWLWHVRYLIFRVIVIDPSIRRNKAVADGAVSYHIDHRVSSRVAKNTYGIAADFLYIDFDPQHISRRNSMYIDMDGRKWISGRFSVVLPRVRIPASLCRFDPSLNIASTSGYQGIRNARIQEILFQN